MIGNPFELRLGTPSAGWLPITVRVGERVYETAASRVLNDPLDELVAAAVALRHDDPLCASVRLWEEPAWKELRFTAERDEEDVVIARRPIASDQRAADPRDQLPRRGVHPLGRRAVRGELRRRDQDCHLVLPTTDAAALVRDSGPA